MKDQKTEDFLAHHGVKGMKWGVRKDRSSGGGGSSSTQNKPKPKASATSSTKKEEAKPASKSGGSSGSGKTTAGKTNQELQEAVNRIRLEQEYARLTAPPKSKGKAIVMDILITTGTEVAKGYAKKYGMHYAGKGLVKLGLPDLGTPSVKKKEDKQGDKNSED